MRKIPFATLATSLSLGALAATQAIELGENWENIPYEAQPNITPTDITYMQSLKEKFAAACRANNKIPQLEAEQELTLIASDQGWNITIQECIANVPFSFGPFYLRQ